MSDAIKIALDQRAQAVIDRMGDAPKLLGAAAEAMDLQNNLTITHISTVRMRGNDGRPFPPEMHILGIRFGKLYQSLRAAPAMVSGSAIGSSIGSHMKYAGTHEFGFSGSVQVSGHTRQRHKTGYWDAGFARLGKRQKVRRTVRQADTFVRPHQRKVNMPARAPIYTGIQDRVEDYGRAMSNAIVEAFEV